MLEFKLRNVITNLTDNDFLYKKWGIRHRNLALFSAFTCQGKKKKRRRKEEEKRSKINVYIFLVATSDV